MLAVEHLGAAPSPESKNLQCVQQGGMKICTPKGSGSCRVVSREEGFWPFKKKVFDLLECKLPAGKGIPLTDAFAHTTRFLGPIQSPEKELWQAHLVATLRIHGDTIRGWANAIDWPYAVFQNPLDGGRVWGKWYNPGDRNYGGPGPATLVARTVGTVDENWLQKIAGAILPDPAKLRDACAKLQANPTAATAAALVGGGAGTAGIILAQRLCGIGTGTPEPSLPPLPPLPPPVPQTSVAGSKIAAFEPAMSQFRVAVASPATPGVFLEVAPTPLAPADAQIVTPAEFEAKLTGKTTSSFFSKPSTWIGVGVGVAAVAGLAVWKLR